MNWMVWTAIALSAATTWFAVVMWWYGGDRLHDMGGAILLGTLVAVALAAALVALKLPT
jgi:hypothetical protein